MSLLLPYTLLLAGCSAKNAEPETVATKPAPPPSNLTPEQKRDYDEAVKGTQPPSSAPAGK